MTADHSLKISAMALPLFGRLYQKSFRTGFGPGLNPCVKTLSRLGYYFLDLCDRRPRYGRCMIECRGRLTELNFNVKNRQFMSLYFHKYSEGYEPAVGAAILALVPEDGVFYDIGSNWGYFSVLLSAQPAFRGKIFAFEPLPSTFEDLRSTIEQLNLGAYITCLPMALGAEDAELRMASGRHSGLARVDAVRGTIPVRVSRLDALDLPAPHLMKIDTEGFEMNVLRGGARILAETRPHIIFEHTCDPSPESLDIFYHLENHGYHLFALGINAVGARSSRPAKLSDWQPSEEWRKLPGFGVCPISAASRPLLAPYGNFLAVHETKKHLIQL